MKPTAMAKPGRNDRCPCGSGKKYKQCCLTKDEAAHAQHGSAMTRDGMAVAQVLRDERAAEQRQSTSLSCDRRSPPCSDERNRKTPRTTSWKRPPMLDFLREHPDYTDNDGLETLYAGLIAKLDPPAAT